MNKKNVLSLISIMSVLLIVFFIAIHFIAKTDHQAPAFKVALFLPAVHPAMDEIIEGFKKTITQESDKKYQFNEYNANGNPTLLRSQADDIVSSNYNLIFTIGASCSHTVFELLRKKEQVTPVVFSAIDDPVGMGIIDSLTSSGNNVTGVVSTTLYEQQIDALLQVKPATQHILLVYNPAHGTGLEKEKELLTTLLKEKNITLHSAQIASANDIMPKVTPFLQGMDVVLILTDHTAVMGVPMLATLCARYGITLYASDLNSGDKGAALAFGVSEYDYGKYAASLAITILEEKRDPSAVPIVRMDKQYLKINTKVMGQQGLALSDQDLAGIQAQGGIII